MIQAAFGIVSVGVGFWAFIYAYSQGLRIHHDTGALFVAGGTAAMMTGLFHFLTAFGFGQ